MPDKLRDVQPVSQRVVRMNGHRHRAASFGLGDLAKGDPRDRILGVKAPGMRNGREIEPRKHREMDHVLHLGRFKIVSLSDALHLGHSLVYECIQTRMKTIVCEPDGAVWPVHHTVAVNLPVQPDVAVNDAEPEVFSLLRGSKGAVKEREKYGKALVLRIAISGGAIDAHAHPMEGLSEGAEEVENSRAFPRATVDLLPALLNRIAHTLMIRCGNSGCYLNTMSACSEPYSFQRKKGWPHLERNVA